MKRFYLLLVSILGALMSVFTVNAEENPTLVPRSCSVGGWRAVYQTTEEIHFNFSGGITVADNVTVPVVSDGEVIATGVLSAKNYSSGSTVVAGAAVITFEESTLPKGRTYLLSVPAGVIFSQKDPSLSNAQLDVEFRIPEYLEEWDISNYYDDILVSENDIVFYYRTEIDAIGEPEFTLLREGVPVRTIPASVVWDWDLGQADARFGETMHFEKGIRYSLILPANSVKSIYRSDITNRERRFDFIGGYTEPLPTINYVWCNLLTMRDFDVLNEVIFYYKQAVKLTPEAKVQLFYVGEDTPIKEVEPVITEENDYWVLTADFGGISLDGEKGFTVVIPEGTLVSAEGDVVINKRESYSVNGTTGMGGITKEKLSVTCNDGLLTVANAGAGSCISVYAADGKVIKDKFKSSGTTTLRLPGKGLFVVTVDGVSYKVLNR